MQTPRIDLFTRLWFAWACFFRVLFDAAFAARAFAVRDRLPEPTAASEPTLEASPAPAPVDPGEAAAGARDEGALLLLSLLQRDGRLVDFLRQDVASFDDAEVGAAARVVHEGCSKALASHVELTPVRDEAEGGAVVVKDDEVVSHVKLTGNVRGKAPYSGKLRHRGWRVTKVTLPIPTKGHDSTIVFPAEVEL